MKNGLPKGASIGGGMKAFMRARAEEKKAREFKKVDVREIVEPDVAEELMPEVIEIVEEVKKVPVIQHGFLQVVEPDFDLVEPEDIITETEVAEEIVMAKPKRKKRGRKGKKKFIATS